MTRVTRELRALALDPIRALRGGGLRAEAIRRRGRSVRDAQTRLALVKRNFSPSPFHDRRLVSNLGRLQRWGTRPASAATGSPDPGRFESPGSTARPCLHPTRDGIYLRSTRWL